MDLKNIIIFASGNGSNFEAIAQATIDNNLNVRIIELICDNPTAYVIQRAKKFNIPILIVDKNQFLNKKNREEFIVQYLKKYEIDLIVLAGYMQIIGDTLLNAYPNKIINIHPSLLPAFKGKDAIQQAYNYGVKFTGVSTHFVDRMVDSGKIIHQAIVPIEKDISLSELETRIHSVEHRLYIETIKFVLSN